MPKTQSRSGMGFYSHTIYKTESQEMPLPEQRLWRAVLGQTLLDAFGPDKYESKKADRTEALHYLTDYDNTSFTTVCENAGFNPEYVREKVNLKLFRK